MWLFVNITKDMWLHVDIHLFHLELGNSISKIWSSTLSSSYDPLDSAAYQIQWTWPSEVGAKWVLIYMVNASYSFDFFVDFKAII